eukprot:g640.t1
MAGSASAARSSYRPAAKAPVRTTERRHEPGDMVVVWRPKRDAGFGGRLCWQNIRPFRVLEARMNRPEYRLQHLTTGSIAIHPAKSCIVPPFRFSIVEEGIYRGAFPTLKNFRFLKRLRLKTVISLVPEVEPTKDLAEFCALEDINNLHFAVEKFTSDVTLDAATVKSIVDIMVNADYHPLYLHCLDGAHVTGMVVMCLRKVQHWKTSSIMDEFCRYMQESSIEKGEASFVKEFAEEILLRLDPPLQQTKMEDNDNNALMKAPNKTSPNRSNEPYEDPVSLHSRLPMEEDDELELAFSRTLQALDLQCAINYS